jgi:hypothetical protein
MKPEEQISHMAQELSNVAFARYFAGPTKAELRIRRAVPETLGQRRTFGGEGTFALGCCPSRFIGGAWMCRVVPKTARALLGPSQVVADVFGQRMRGVARLRDELPGEIEDRFAWTDLAFGEEGTGSAVQDDDPFEAAVPDEGAGEGDDVRSGPPQWAERTAFVSTGDEQGGGSGRSHGERRSMWVGGGVQSGSMRIQTSSPSTPVRW